MLIKRFIQPQIEKSLFIGKVVVICGARQVGKTTLVKEIGQKYGDYSYFSCDEPDVVTALSGRTSTELIDFLGSKRLIIIDEAQRVPNIGLTLKLLADNFPKTQFVATGSSSFDLANEISEPLTGRKRVFHLFPVSMGELAGTASQTEAGRLLEKRLIFGLYPEVISSKTDALAALKEIATSYLYKDIFKFEEIKNQDVVADLVKALALQIGGEVSYNELSKLLGIDRKTVRKYVSILERAFVIFRARPWHRNKRTELGKLRKIYFYDNGLRNMLINNLNPLNLRTDVGALWENFMMSEIIKAKSFRNEESDIHFWRTYARQEVDYIEELSGEMIALEFKWSKDARFKIPKIFSSLYPGVPIKVISPANFWKAIRSSGGKD